MWIAIQFLLDLSLLFIIIYLFYKGKKGDGPLSADESQSDVNMNKEANELIEKLKMYIEEAKTTSDKVTEELNDKMRRMELLSDEVQKLYRRVDEQGKEKGSQKYVEAIKLAKEGKEAEQICKELGLLRGEVDLIIALNKVDGS